MALSDGQADLVFTGGKIRSPAHPSGFVQALAVRRRAKFENGKIKVTKKIML